MKSRTKVDLSPAQLDAAVKRAFGVGAALVSHEEFHEGWFNTIHGLTLADGRRFVLKTAPKPGVPVLRHEHDLLETEVAVYRLLDGTGVPAPRVSFYDSGSETLGLPYFLMDWITLPTLSKVGETLPAEDKKAAVRSLGEVNARFNAVRGPAFGAVHEGGARHPRWSEAFSRLVEGTLADGEDRGSALPVSPGEVRSALHRHRAVLDLVTEPHLVHWDLHDSNVFLDGTRVAAVIDADRSQWADPLMEIYWAPFFDRDAFAEGYGIDLRNTEGGAIRRALYDIHLGLVMTIESDYRGFEADHRQWASDFLREQWEKLKALR